MTNGRLTAPQEIASQMPSSNRAKINPTPLTTATRAGIVYVLRVEDLVDNGRLMWANVPLAEAQVPPVDRFAGAAVRSKDRDP